MTSSDTASPPPAAKRGLPYWLKLVLAAGIIAVLVVIAKSWPSSAATSTRSATAAPQPVATQPAVAVPQGPLTVFSDGTYEVGRDITAGTYVAPGGSGSSCYWERASEPSGNLRSIISNGRTKTGQVLVTAAPGEFLRVEGCGTFTKR